MKKYDIVVIGGGFAGASLVYRLSKLNSSLEIALIERSSIGEKPVSAFTFTDVIDDLEIENAVKQQYNQIEIISTLGAKISYVHNGDIFSLLDYKKACKDLVKRSGCQVMFEEVKSVKGGKVTLKTGALDAKIIVDASGRNYKFRKELNLDVPKIENHVYIKKFTRCNISNPKSVHLVVGDIGTNGGWFYPINENECEIGVAERTNKLSKHEKANISNKQKKNMEQFLSYPPYSEMLNESRCKSEVMTYYPYEPVKHVMKGNVVFLGDSAGMVNPIFGMGIHYIDRISRSCAEYCAKAALDDISVLREYQNLWNKYLQSDMNAWIQGMIFWDLDLEQLNEIMQIQNNSNINNTNLLTTLRGHCGKDYTGDTFKVPLGLYLTIVKYALKYKIISVLKYKC